MLNNSAEENNTSQAQQEQEFIARCNSNFDRLLKDIRETSPQALTKQNSHQWVQEFENLLSFYFYRSEPINFDSVLQANRNNIARILYYQIGFHCLLLSHYPSKDTDTIKRVLQLDALINDRLSTLLQVTDQSGPLFGSRSKTNVNLDSDGQIDTINHEKVAETTPKPQESNTICLNQSSIKNYPNPIQNLTRNQ